APQRPPPVVGESQQVERPRTTGPWPVPRRRLPRRRAERHEPRLGWVDAQAVLAEALRQDLQDALGIALVAKPNHEIVRVADEEGTLTQAWLHVPLDPEVQHVVQEHVGQQG